MKSVASLVLSWTDTSAPSVSTRRDLPGINDCRTLRLIKERSSHVVIGAAAADRFTRTISAQSQESLQRMGKYIVKESQISSLESLVDTVFPGSTNARCPTKND